MIIICNLLSLYLLIVFAAIIMSWFPLEPGGVAASIYRVLWQLTNPILGPIRSVLPDIPMGGMRLDLSPLVLLIAVRVIQAVICH